MIRKLSLLVIAVGSFLPVSTHASDYALSLEGTGLRDYYCQITVALENRTEAPLTEINGFFYAFVGEEKVGRSKGSGFLSVDPAARVEVTFETPNAPCDQIDRYEFVVGACRIGASFEDKAECAGRLEGARPITIQSAGGS